MARWVSEATTSVRSSPSCSSRPATSSPTDRLIDLLWGDAPPRTAPTSLSNALTKLRRELGSEVLERRAPGYVLRVEPERIDAHRFERALRDARRAHGSAERRLGRPGSSDDVGSDILWSSDSKKIAYTTSFLKDGSRNASPAGTATTSPPTPLPSSAVCTS